MNQSVAKGRELWLDKLESSTCYWVAGQRKIRVEKENVLTGSSHQKHRAGLGEKHLLKGRDNPFLERKSEGQNPHVLNTLNSGQVKI